MGSATLTALLVLTLCSAAFTQPEDGGPPGGGRGRQPPQSAIDACSGQSKGADCSFTTPRGSEPGNCYRVRGGQFACIPKDAPRPPEEGGGPPPDEDRPPRNEGSGVDTLVDGSGTGAQTAGATKEDIQSAVSAAVKQAMSEQNAAKPGQPKVSEPVSDVDTPEYAVSEKPDHFALVIGISKYSNVPEAEFAYRDALSMHKHLLAMGYPEQNIITLYGAKATKGAIAAKLENWLPKNVDEKSTVFVYYSGHGAPDPESKEAYLVPWDADPEALPETAFPLARFYKDLGKLKARQVLVALDACFSGAGGRSVVAKGTKPLVNVIAATAPAGDKVTIFTASQAQQISGTLEDQGHGAFTYYFLKGLNGAAESKHREGHVTAGSLFTYLSPLVSAAAHRHSREQQPQLLPSLDKSAGIELR